MKFSRSILPAAASFCALGFSAHLLFAQEEAPSKPTVTLTPPNVEVENDAAIEAGEDKLELRSGKARIAGPPGVIIAAPDEEIILESKPRKVAQPVGVKPPKAEKKVRIVKMGEGEDALERRLERLEQKLEALADNDRMLRKQSLALNEKQLAKIQGDIDRATREADVAVRRFKFHPGEQNDFVFEHKIAIAGDARSQRKALEAQRKALEKQLESINQRLEAIEENDTEGDEDRSGGSGGVIEFKNDNAPGRKGDDAPGRKDSAPALPPDSAP
ncbi:MAG TPA: hypothetical protein VF773_04030 [Verrucomicrobiae bacterium]